MTLRDSKTSEESLPARLIRTFVYSEPETDPDPEEMEEGKEQSPPLQKLPSTPTRSVGGYLDYEGWRDCQRFLELDCALKRSGLDEAPETFATRRCTARLAGGSQCGNRFARTGDYPGSRCPDHRNRSYKVRPESRPGDGNSGSLLRCA